MDFSHNEAHGILQKATITLMANVIQGLEDEEPLDIQLQGISIFLRDGHQDNHVLHLATVTILELSIRLWSMCEITIRPESQMYWQLGSNHALWEDNTHSLRQQMETCFPESSIHEEDKLYKSFRLYDIQKVANIEVIWTSNLLDHLRVEDPPDNGKPYTVFIFHHRRFLEYHRDRTSRLYPDGLIEETLKTLDLLLPREHKGTRKWYKTIAAKYDLDHTACKSGRLLHHQDRLLESFTFWRDRLTILKDVFDEIEPSTILHFWLDKRHPVQWATFWVAVLVFCLTVFFGIVQSIEGALQVYKAYHPTPN
ncbi:hypothetical protein BJX99DRAFT_253419 [Aspergillus californicus]